MRTSPVVLILQAIILLFLLFRILEGSAELFDYWFAVVLGINIAVKAARRNG